MRDASLKSEKEARRKAKTGEENEVGAPTPGLITGVFVQPGDEVEKNAKLLTLEAMKMQSTVYAPVTGKIAEVLVDPGDQVEAKDLLIVLD